MQQNQSIVKFQNLMEEIGLEAVLLNTSEITRSINLRRLSGFSGSDAGLLITQREAHLFTDGRYKSQSGIECPGIRIHITRNKIKSISSLIKSRGIRSVCLEGTRISYEFISTLRKKTPGIDFVNLKRSLLDELRILKTPQEVETIRTAAELASDACMEIIALGLSGRAEAEVAADLENLFRRKGASGASFNTIVASGVRSALPHGTATSKIINDGELVIIDFGCRLSGYCSDETLTCIVNCDPHDKQQQIYQAVRDAHDRAIEAIRIGVKASAVDKVARESIAAAGFGDYFLHSLGHGVGLEVHEAPYLSPGSKDTLECGMVFTVEPGVYLEGAGGVRLESLIYLAENGPVILNTAPKTLIRAT